MSACQHTYSYTIAYHSIISNKTPHTSTSALVGAAELTDQPTNKKTEVWYVKVWFRNATFFTFKHKEWEEHVLPGGRRPWRGQVRPSASRSPGRRSRGQWSHHNTLILFSHVHYRNSVFCWWEGAGEYTLTLFLRFAFVFKWSLFSALLHICCATMPSWFKNVVLISLCPFVLGLIFRPLQIILLCPWLGLPVRPSNSSRVSRIAVDCQFDCLN